MSEYFELKRRWVNWMTEARGMSPETIRNYTNVVRNFIDAAEMEPSEVRDDDVSLYLKALGQTGPSRNRTIQGLRSFFGWMSDKGIIESNPLADFKPKHQKYTSPRCLTPKQIQDVLRAADTMDHRRRLVIEMMYRTGMRVGSAAHLRPGDVDMDAGVIRVMTAKGDKPYEVSIGRKLRPILRELLETYDAERGPYLVGVKDRSLWLWCKRAGEEAGIARVHPHLLRHSFATHLLAKGANIEQVRVSMNHGSLAVTQQYLTTVREELTEAQDLLP